MKIDLYDILINIGRYIGIFSFLFLGFSIFLGASYRLIGNYINIQKLLKFHKKFGYFSFCVLIFHPILITTANIIDGTNIVDFYSSYITYIPFILGLSAFYIFAAVIIISILRKLVNRFVWITLMRLTIIAFIFAGYHILNFSVLSGLHPQIPILNIPILLGIIFAGTGTLIRIILLIKTSKLKKNRNK